MSWETGSQKRKKGEDFNKLLSEIEGYVEDEDEAKILLYKFLRENSIVNFKSAKVTPYCKV